MQKSKRRGDETRYERRVLLRFHLLPEDNLGELAGTLKRTWHVARRRISRLAPSLARLLARPLARSLARLPLARHLNACGGAAVAAGTHAGSGRRSGAPRRDCRRAARLKNHTMTSSAPAVLSSPAHVTLSTNRPENIAVGADAAVFRRLPRRRYGLSAGTADASARERIRRVS